MELRKNVKNNVTQDVNICNASYKRTQRPKSIISLYVSMQQISSNILKGFVIINLKICAKIQLIVLAISKLPAVKMEQLFPNHIHLEFMSKKAKLT